VSVRRAGRPARIVARALPAVRPPPVLTDPDVVAGVLEDASHLPGGHAAGLVRPENEAEVAAALADATRRGQPVLAIGAQSSLTGGAVPVGDLVISTARLDAIGPASAGTAPTVRAGAGVRLDRLLAELAARDLYYPPVPTYQLACLGGTVATNAAGSATFKYGPTRPWVRALRVLTVEGWLLSVVRGEHRVAAGDDFEIELPDGAVRRVTAPTYRPPAVKKCSMGYHAADELDLIDLFIGSEGTLGVVTEIEVSLIPAPAGVLAALVLAPGEAAALELVGELREASERCRAGSLDDRLDVRAIEHMDGASLDLVRARGQAARLKVPLPADARMALYLEVELPVAAGEAAILADLDAVIARGGRVPQAVATAGPRQLFEILARRGLLDRLELAFPLEPGRLAAFRELRESVPMAVNETVRERQARLDPRIHKLAGDMCVPFPGFADLLAVQRRELEARGLEHVVFGHVSDGNVHPNVLARSHDEMLAGREALLAVAARVKEMGGSPLAEHGVGRNPTKQEMLARHYGPDGLARMRAVKTAMDPEGRLARGVLFPAVPAAGESEKKFESAPRPWDPGGP
jgi:D-lactate dehydrogenase (cytochrome)